LGSFNGYPEGRPTTKRGAADGQSSITTLKNQNQGKRILKKGIGQMVPGARRIGRRKGQARGQGKGGDQVEDRLGGPSRKNPSERGNLHDAPKLEKGGARRRNNYFEGRGPVKKSREGL